MPANFTLNDIKIFYTYYVGAAGFKSGSFDELVWEVKEKDHIQYAIVKMVMKKSPLGRFPIQGAISLKLAGTLAVDKK